MNKALAFRLDRLVLDTRRQEIAFLRRFLAAMVEGGFSRLFTVRQLQAANRALSTSPLTYAGGLGARRWDLLAHEALRRCYVQPTPAIEQLINALVQEVHETPVPPTLGIRELLEDLKTLDVRVFGYAWGDGAEYRHALRAAGLENAFLDILIDSDPDTAEWTTFWERHACIGSDAGPAMLVITPDHYYDPPRAFEVRAACVLYEHAGQGPELEGVRTVSELHHALVAFAARESTQ